MRYPGIGRSRWNRSNRYNLLAYKIHAQLRPIVYKHAKDRDVFPWNTVGVLTMANATILSRVTHYRETGFDRKSCKGCPAKALLGRCPNCWPFQFCTAWVRITFLKKKKPLFTTKVIWAVKLSKIGTTVILNRYLMVIYWFAIMRNCIRLFKILKLHDYNS